MQMTRWDNAYNEFQTTWKQIKENDARLIITEGMEAGQLAEIARLKRVIEYVDGVQEAGLKDLMPLNTIVGARDTSNNILGQINAYNSNLNIGHIHEANNQLDHLLSLICPFVMNSKPAAQAAGRAFGLYRNTVEKYTNDLEGRSKALVGNIDSWHGDMSKKYTEMNNVYKRFIEGDEGVSMKAQIDEFHAQIIAFYENLLEDVVDNENEENNKLSIKTKIEKAKGLILNELAMVAEETETLKGFYGEVFGAKIEEGERAGERDGGLKQEMDDRRAELSNYVRKQREIIRLLKSKINNLLQGATSAGLASAFMDLKLESKKSAKRYTLLFGLSLFFLFIIAGVSIIPEICYAYPKIFEVCKGVTDGSWLSWVRGVLAKALFILPALWFAIFTSKRRSEHQRLEQEYAHKEAVSKSFEGYKTQIKELEQELQDETLLPELLKTAIKAIDYNASTTLGGKHGDSPPIAEAGKIVGAIKNILKSSN